MLADLAKQPPISGSLTSELQSLGGSLKRLVAFIADQLPPWRDHPDRRNVTSERALTEQLCTFLNGAARRSGFDSIQFVNEAPDNLERGRTLDMSAKPCGTALHIEGRRYSEFETLLPIECKRLPTPVAGNRDAREYVTTRNNSRGGAIQRFKLGLHGGQHDLAVIVAYVQQGRAQDWVKTINEWIAEVGASDAFWADEQLTNCHEGESPNDTYQLHSVHARRRGKHIELSHLWICMAQDDQDG